MSDWDETDKEMGWNDPSKESKFVSLNEGDDEVVTYESHEHVTCNDDDKYCDDNGETIQYYFTSPLTGFKRELRRSSKGIFYAFKNAKVEPGQTIQIIRTGTGQSDTRYEIKVLTDAEVAKWKEEKEKAIAETQTEAPPSDMRGTYDSPAEVVKKNEEPTPEEEVKIEDIPF